MERLLIILLAVVGMASNAGPTPPPAVDWIMWVLCASFMFLLGVRLDDWLNRLAARPRWRRVRRSRGRQLRVQPRDEEIKASRTALDGPG